MNPFFLGMAIEAFLVAIFLGLDKKVTVGHLLRTGLVFLVIAYFWHIAK